MNVDEITGDITDDITGGITDNVTEDITGNITAWGYHRGYGVFGVMICFCELLRVSFLIYFTIINFFGCVRKCNIPEISQVFYLLDSEFSVVNVASSLTLTYITLTYIQLCPGPVIKFNLGRFRMCSLIFG